MINEKIYDLLELAKSTEDTLEILMKINIAIGQMLSLDEDGFDELLSDVYDTYSHWLEVMKNTPLH